MTRAEYFIPDPASLSALTQALAKYFSIRMEEEKPQRLTVLETFDWRLFKQGYLLVKNSRSYELIAIDSRRCRARQDLDTQRTPRFAWDLPDSPLRDQLSAWIEMRALLPIARITRQRSLCCLLDAQEKTVVRLLLEKSTMDNDGPSQFRCRLQEIKGYPKAAKKAKAMLAKARLEKAPTAAFIELIVADGQEPAGYSSKVRVPMDREMPAGIAAQRILAHLVGVMQANHNGVLKDIDSEFLHDFRVAVRRSRSLLSQVKQVFSLETTAKLQQHLKWLGQITGPLRDLDVYLLKQAHYSELVTEPLRPGIDRLFEALASRRRYALGKLRRAMRDQAFAETMDLLTEFVSAPLSEQDASAVNAHQTMGSFAQAVIYKRYRKVIKAGRAIDDGSPDEDLHRLRIDCKKLRYLMEFFTPLFPEAAIKTLIKQLKSLQENLGDFNDLSVQQDFLYHYLGQLSAQKEDTTLQAAAVGALVMKLHLAHRNLREDFMGVFRHFNAKNNRLRFKNLFVPQESV